MSDRRRVERLLDELPPGAIRRDGAEPAFETAGELRAFALAVAAQQSGQYSWAEFQQALIDAIGRWEATETDAPWRYYEHWLEALERVLTGSGTVSPAELDARTHQVLTTPRDASHHRARRDPVTVDPGSR